MMRNKKEYGKEQRKDMMRKKKGYCKEQRK